MHIMKHYDYLHYDHIQWVVQEKCLLPFRLWPKPVPPTPKVSQRFSQPNEDDAQKVTHAHILSESKKHCL